MELITSAIVDGKILDKYGKRGDLTLSMPFEFRNYPENTVSFALIIEDYDAIEVCGYDYIHWLVCNISGDRLRENASILSKEYFIQGVNSNNENSYIGMAPPNKSQTYDITLYTLDIRLDLEEGFNYTELKNKMSGHILSEVNIKGIYDN